MKIQLKRSNVIDGGAAKEPTSAQMEYGELAVNYSDADPAIFIKDSTDKIVRIAGKGANGGTELPDSGGGTHQPGTTDDRYVEITGDNMTGDLTLGTDKITLDASGGSAVFASDVRAGGDLVVDNNRPAGAILKADGQLRAATASKDSGVLSFFVTGEQSPQYLVTANGQTTCGLASAQTVNLRPGITGTGDSIWLENPGNYRPFRIGADGSSSFAGEMNVGDIYTGGGSRLLPRGEILIREDNSAAAVFNIFSGGTTNSDNTIAFLADGSANFAGDVYADKQFRTKNGYGQPDAAVLGVVVEGSNGTANASIAYDGSATFADGAFVIDSNGIIQTNIQTAGTIKLDSTGDFTDPNITLNAANGSATFAGNVEAGNLDIASTSAIGSSVRADGLVRAQRAASSSSAVFQGWRGNLATSEIKSDGSSSFSGDMEIKDSSYLRIRSTSSNAQTAVQLSPDGSSLFAGPITVKQDLSSSFGSPAFEVSNAGEDQVIRLNNDGTAYFKGNVTSDGTIGFNLESDDETKYTTDVDADGNETRVYNGTVLDVKERIQNVLARMDAIEANEITDDATDNALLSLVASLTARLDERDTAIAALTARVTTLEG